MINWKDWMLLLVFCAVLFFVETVTWGSVPTYPEYHWRLVSEVEFVLIREQGYKREIVAKTPVNSIEYKTPNACAKAGEQLDFPLPMMAPANYPDAQMVPIITCLPYKTGQDTKDKTP